jgi:hypothetical protein
MRADHLPTGNHYSRISSKSKKTTEISTPRVSHHDRRKPMVTFEVYREICTSLR